MGSMEHFCSICGTPANPATAHLDGKTRCEKHYFRVIYVLRELSQAKPEGLGRRKRRKAA